MIFKSMIEDDMLKMIQGLNEEISFLIRKTYTDEELDRMPQDMYDKIVASQKKRAALLQAIAKKYKL